MGNKVYQGDELQTALTVDKEQYAPILTMLRGRQVSQGDIDKLIAAYGICRKKHPRLREIMNHITATLQAFVEEPLSPLGRSIQFEHEGISFHVMQIPIYSMEKSNLPGTLKNFFKSISTKDFRKIIGKEQ